jgi:hypothetical protein
LKLYSVTKDFSTEILDITIFTVASNSSELKPYKDDLDYLQDHFRVIELRIKKFSASIEEEDSYKFQAGKGQKTKLRELESQEKQAYRKCIARLQVTKDANSNGDNWIPRLERLAIARNLDEFERWVILTLVGCVISVKIMKAAGVSPRYRESITVGEMLAANVCSISKYRFIFCCSKYLK